MNSKHHPSFSMEEIRDTQRRLLIANDGFLPSLLRLPDDYRQKFDAITSIICRLSENWLSTTDSKKIELMAKVKNERKLKNFRCSAHIKQKFISVFFFFYYYYDYDRPFRARDSESFLFFHSTYYSIQIFPLASRAYACTHMRFKFVSRLLSLN